MRKYDKSLKFHLKHEEFADKESVYAGVYNIALSFRFLKKYEKSIEYFSRAIGFSKTVRFPFNIN